MGSPMAGFLSKKHDVSIYNRTKSKCDNWIKNYKGKVIDKLSETNQKYDFIISNPPYIDPVEMSEMLPNVLVYEPHLALFAPKEQPLYFYKKIVTLAQHSLKSDGCLYLEINPKFKENLLGFIKSKTFKDIEVRNDIFGKKRMLKAVKS